ncbi:MAG: polysaccharide deacetylase family protein [Candidatus Omnitrophica bacterium]|nr:polysaccharide deacetylase family protein [Candidatus Omnitrophota bacterium]
MIKNEKNFALTLDLEPEHAGLSPNYDIFRDKGKIEEILSLITSLGVKITVFIVGEIFDRRPDIIKIFEKYNCEFEIHSYSHNHANLSDREEIEKAKKMYINYFSKSPKGYRAPCGRISKETIALLEEYGFLYDSSIFPSYYPDPLHYLFCNRNIHYFHNSRIMEIPLTSITPFRLTLSLSYLKLLGLNLYFNLLKIFKLPDFICFNTHLHDFIVYEESLRKLPPFWKFVYSRNKLKGIDYSVEFIDFIKTQGYQFCFMSEIYEKYKNILH